MNLRFFTSPLHLKLIYSGCTLFELAMHVKDDLLVGSQPCELFPDEKQARLLIESGYWPMETRYGRRLDGSVLFFALIKMPGVTSSMWDWWFAWHGIEAQRYQLLRPRAHVHALYEEFGPHKRWANTGLLSKHRISTLSQVFRRGHAGFAQAVFSFCQRMDGRFGRLSAPGRFWLEQQQRWYGLLERHRHRRQVLLFNLTALALSLVVLWHYRKDLKSDDLALSW